MVVAGVLKSPWASIHTTFGSTPRRPSPARTPTAAQQSAEKTVSGPSRSTRSMAVANSSYSGRSARQLGSAGTGRSKTNSGSTGRAISSRCSFRWNGTAMRTIGERYRDAAPRPAAGSYVHRVRSIDWRDGRVVIIDQTVLPHELRTLELTSVDELVDAIGRLAVRGAPALGAAGALGVALAVDQGEREGWDKAQLNQALARLRAARPTAVNLAWGVDRAVKRVADGRDAVLKEALEVLEEDVAANRSIGERGADLLSELLGDEATAATGVRIQTHCNTGSLATVDWGTALGVVRSLHQRGRLGLVYVDETRPLLQGSRLTAWELEQLAIVTERRIIRPGNLTDG